MLFPVDFYVRPFPYLLMKDTKRLMQKQRGRDTSTKIVRRARPSSLFTCVKEMVKQKSCSGMQFNILNGTVIVLSVYVHTAVDQLYMYV